MPSSYLLYASDFDRDGRRDIWRSTADTLASIANDLRHFGWHNGETWGREVKLNAAARSRIDSIAARKEGCSAFRALTAPRALGEWAADGVRLANGGPLPPTEIAASLVLTADTRTFLVCDNYESLLAYNCSHYYALSVAMLADAIRQAVDDHTPAGESCHVRPLRVRGLPNRVLPNPTRAAIPSSQRRELTHFAIRRHIVTTE